MTTLPLIDFHCHVDLYPDPPQVIADCDRLGVRTLAVTTTPRAWQQNVEWTRGSTHVRAALGFHPQVVATHAHELPLFEDLIQDARYIGEVGLDASPAHYASFAEQTRVFRRILGLCADAGDKILSIHSVRSASKILDHIEELLPPNRGRVVLHWFSGSKSEARRAVAMGCYFSLNAPMLAEKRREITMSIPLDRLLTETDGPFTQMQDRAAIPMDVGETVRQCAIAWDESIESIAQRFQNNLARLLGKAN